jgi:hypothetical protein
MDDFNDLNDLEITEAFIPFENKDPYELAIENLTKISDDDKTWIAIPREGGKKVEVFDIESCDNDKFFEWLMYIWPLCKDMKHVAEDYNKVSYKIAAVKNVFFLHQKAKFPKQKD